MELSNDLIAAIDSRVSERIEAKLAEIMGRSRKQRTERRNTRCSSEQMSERKREFLAFMMERGNVSKGDLAEKFSVSLGLMKNDIQGPLIALLREGKIARVGKGRFAPTGVVCTP